MRASLCNGLMSDDSAPGYDMRDLELAARQLHTIQRLFVNSIKRCLDVGFHPDEISVILGLPFETTEAMVKKWFPDRD